MECLSKQSQDSTVADFGLTTSGSLTLESLAASHDELVKFPDWHEPARLLRAACGPSTDEQRRIAAALGYPFGNEPRDVLAASIEAWLEPALWGRSPPPATERQLAFLRGLGHVAGECGLVRPVASAWIQHYLSLRTAEGLESLGLRAGQRIHIERQFTDPDTGEISSFNDEGTVSSIGANGLVYFRGGNGKCAWPGDLRRL